MIDCEEVAFVALIGQPVLEVAAIVMRHGKMIDKFHEFVNYFNVNLEGYHTEMEPVTDSWGTRHTHGIGEMELDQVGKPLYIVQDRLRLFLAIFGSNLKIIVNECERKYKTEELPTHSQQYSWKQFKQALQMERCSGHRSIYFKDRTHEPQCALRVACTMVMEGNKFVQTSQLRIPDIVWS